MNRTFIDTARHYHRRPCCETLMRTMHKWCAALWALGCAACWGQAAPPRDGGIYVCVDDAGRAITRDRYIAECRHKEQRILNRDGSLRMRLPPTLTAEERAQADAEQRERREREEAQKDVVKYDLLLKRRFLNEAMHQRARDGALVASVAAMESAEARLRELAAERKKLSNEAEFYRGRVVPARLKQQIDNNDAQADAQRTAIKNSQAEQERINKRFDAELARLRKLWRGAEPGTLGPPLQ
jgi:hypothetical protein